MSAEPFAWDDLSDEARRWRETPVSPVRGGSRADATPDERLAETMATLGEQGRYPKLTLSRSIALALTLTLSLTACGTEETAPTAATLAPEPMLQELAAAPLVADGPPVVTGGTLVDRVFQSDESRGEHCVSYRAALPPALKGMELRVAPVVPIISLAGRPSCSGPVQAALTYSTDAWIWPRALPAEQVAMERGASMLTINLCFRGVQRAQLGDLSGSVSYARIQPLHR